MPGLDSPQQQLRLAAVLLLCLSRLACITTAGCRRTCAEAVKGCVTDRSTFIVLHTLVIRCDSELVQAV